MPHLSELFRTIHRLRRHSRDLQVEIDRGPIQLKARQNHATKQAAAAVAAKEALKKRQAQVRDMENELKTSHETAAKYTRQRGEVTEAKAFEALQHEIATEQGKASALEESIFAGMAEVDEMTAAVPVAEQAAKKAAQDLASFDSEQKTKLAHLAEEMKKALVELKAAEAQLPEEVRPEYVRRVASYGADALASIEGGCCTYCRTGASQQQIINLGRDHFVTCTSCYRGLYLPE